MWLQETAPARVARRDRLCRNSRPGWGPLGAWPAEVLALGDEVGRLLASISFGLRRALRLGLRIADGLGQHLAKLGLGLRRLSREGFCPCSHKDYMGMPEGELKPAGDR